MLTSIYFKTPEDYPPVSNYATVAYFDRYIDKNKRTL